MGIEKSNNPYTHVQPLVSSNVMSVLNKINIINKVQPLVSVNTNILQQVNKHPISWTTTNVTLHVLTCSD
jgi:hypothetical protein